MEILVEFVCMSEDENLMNLLALKGEVSCKRYISLRGSFCKEII
jgi:hypothetical protein